MEGIFITLEGTAQWAAHKRFKAETRIAKHEKVVLINTRSGYKYLKNIFTGKYI